MRLGMRSLMAIVTVSLLVAACGGDADDGGVDDGGLAAETGATGPTEGDTPGGGVFPPSTGSAVPTGTTASTGEGDVQVLLVNYGFAPDPVEVASGDVIAVRNGNTRTPHTFTVLGQDVDLELAPLETETVEISLDPGTYELICRFHEAQDMTATLIVS